MDLSVLKVSIPYIVITAGIVRLTRQFILSIFGGKSPLVDWALLEFFATFEFLATVFEIGILFETYGFGAFVLALVVMVNYWGRAFKGATGATHPHLADMLHGTGNKNVIMAKIFGQIMASSLVFHFYVKLYWSLGFLPIHGQRLSRIASCASFLKVPIYYGVVLEAMGTLLFTMLSVHFRTKSYSSLTIPISLALVKRIGMPLTGGFLNPILATTLQFNCVGTSAFEHVFVYWIGPVAGLLAYRILIAPKPTPEKASAPPPNQEKKADKKAAKDKKKD